MHVAASNGRLAKKGHRPDREQPSLPARSNEVTE
jgi:hypothetical protein